MNLRRIFDSTSACSPIFTHTVIQQQRFKSLRIRIANRMTTERFHATRYIIPTRLETAAPTIAEEWDFDKNPMHIYPKIVGVASLKPAWWVCRNCKHSFEASPEKRVLRGFGCPNCQNPEKQAAPEIDDHTVSQNTTKTTKKRKLSRSKKLRGTRPAPVELLPGETDPYLKPKRTHATSTRTRY